MKAAVTGILLAVLLAGLCLGTGGCGYLLLDAGEPQVIGANE